MRRRKSSDALTIIQQTLNYPHTHHTIPREYFECVQPQAGWWTAEGWRDDRRKTGINHLRPVSKTRAVSRATARLTKRKRRRMRPPAPFLRAGRRQAKYKKIHKMPSPGEERKELHHDENSCLAA